MLSHVDCLSVKVSVRGKCVLFSLKASAICLYHVLKL